MTKARHNITHTRERHPTAMIPIWGRYGETPARVQVRISRESEKLPGACHEQWFCTSLVQVAFLGSHAHSIATVISTTITLAPDDWQCLYRNTLLAEERVAVQTHRIRPAPAEPKALTACYFLQQLFVGNTHNQLRAFVSRIINFCYFFIASINEDRSLFTSVIKQAKPSVSAHTHQRITDLKRVLI